MAAEPTQRRLQFVLREYGKYPNENVTLCYFGMANEVFIVPTAQGRFVLKNCFKSNTRQLVSNEVALIEHLNRHGCPTPSIVAAKDGSPFVEFDNQFYVMTEYCSDTTFNWESEIPQQAHCEAVHALADFHNACRNFTEPHPGLRIEFLDMQSSRLWLEELAQDLQMQESSRESVREMTELIPRLITLSQQLEDEMSGLDLSVLRKSHIHGDLHCYNLFYDDEGNYSKVVDFDFSRHDHCLADICWSSRIFFSKELYKRYTREELSSDDFELPQEVAEEILLTNWRMIISEYRKYADLPAEELALVHLFIKALPLYIVRFFKFSNSEAECLVHINWFKDELEKAAKYSSGIQSVVTRIANDLAQ